MKIKGLSKLNLYQEVEKINRNLDFGKVLFEKLKEIDNKEKEAQATLEKFARGEDIDPAEMALKISTADASMKLLLRIRNKVLEAYQEIMRMQI
ncbi:MAG: flagellar hook-basal body complex protein FliE [Caldimicrobium sp.]|jgi:flagellar hook-basal body complex protein FliE|uniref:Flagellar hook-basal body complex protein FliE n=1 Tax=Caldimicrobium thiodismutans TaxID=1653476 RepID=A0A2N7PKB9_9BACT|nr:MAG: flagellar hook-basal body complex protein FliE [Caldimicrobium thiodismutans]